MIHDANDTHLVGHTFATTDTTVVLTWTETSYGEKTYTKLSNEASIGTETITLTDPNTPTTPTFSAPETTIDILTGWKNYNWIYDETLNGVDNWTYKLDVANSFRIHFYYNNADGSRWVDGDGDPASLSQSGDTITMNIDGNANHSTFIDPYYGKVYEAPPTIKWNFSDKHDGTAEGFNVHDDQTPPCYVEKSADGTWSLTLTGDLADRQDLNPGNNWDYIETSGGTVYLKYKSWDAGGYWNGPYTRAQWSSSIGSETIRIYEHSSYSEPYNNAIYLIQQGEAFTNYPSTIAFTG